MWMQWNPEKNPFIKAISFEDIYCFAAKQLDKYKGYQLQYAVTCSFFIVKVNR